MTNPGADARVLLLDTSGDTGTVALAVDGALRSERTMERAQDDYAAVLNETIAEALADGGVQMGELTAVCVMAGPGSYTGLRIALAAAKGLCYALDIPLFLQNGLQLLAEEARAAKPEYDAYLVILPARKGEYFFAAYDAEGGALIEPRHLKLPDAEEVLRLLPERHLIIGNGESWAEIVAETSAAADSLMLSRSAPSLEAWLRIALAQVRAGHADDLAYAEPFYLKAAHTTTPKVFGQSH